MCICIRQSITSTATTMMTATTCTIIPACRPQTGIHIGITTNLSRTVIPTGPTCITGIRTIEEAGPPLWVAMAIGSTAGKATSEVIEIGHKWIASARIAASYLIGQVRPGIDHVVASVISQLMPEH